MFEELQADRIVGTWEVRGRVGTDGVREMGRGHIMKARVRSFAFSF